MNLTPFEYDIYKSVVHNASLFLKDGVSKLFEDKDFRKTSLTKDTFVLAVSNIQMAMELAAKAYIIWHKGLKFVVHSSQSKLSMDKLERLYKDKRLKVQEFETISKQLNGLGMDLKLTKSQRTKIGEFQNYRNKLFHLTCDVTPEELEAMRDSLLLYSINTVMYLLFDKYQNERPTDFMAQLTNWDYFRTLQHSTCYRESMRMIAKESGDTILLCPVCDDLSYSKEEEYCYVCGFNGWDLGRADCEECGGVNTVIFSRGAHHIGNPHLHDGFCQVCEAKNAIYECPECGRTFHYFFANGKPNCTDGKCVNRE